MKLSDLKGEVRVIAGPPLQPQTPSTTQNIGNTIKDVSLGIGSSYLGALQSAGSAVNAGLNQTVGRAIDAATGKKFASTDYSIKPGLTSAQVREKLTPQNDAQSFGKAVGDISQYFIPAAKAAKAERIVTTLTKGIGNGLLAAGARIGGKAGIQGATAGGVNLLQTGGDLKQAGNTALIAGGISGALGSVGEAARALKLPERLYQTVFKNAKNDMLAEFKTDYLSSLAKTNPDKYKELVSAGIIKTGVGGTPRLNETLAEQALNRGLKGSIKSMANEVVGKTLESEYKLQQLAKAYKGTVDLSEAQFKNVLREIAEEYSNVGFGEISKKATALADIVESSVGKVTAETALAVRRLLDNARIARSFDVPANKLSLSQANLKTLADAARQRVNNVPGFGPIMKDYSFYIEALEQLAREGARRGNTQIISLIDSIFLGGGIASGAAIPAGILGGTRKILQSGRGATSLGSAIKNGLGAKTIGVTGAISNPLGAIGQEQ